MSYPDYQKLFKSITDKEWERAQFAISLAEKKGLITEWYAFWKNPRTLHEKYDYAFWLNFYIYQDLRQLAKTSGENFLVSQIDKAYYSGDWHRIK